MNQTMTSITIHNLDPVLMSTLREQAEQTSVSLNKLIKSLLTHSLGLSKNPKVADFSAFTNQWSLDDAREFQESQTEFSDINLADWQ